MLADERIDFGDLTVRVKPHLRSYDTGMGRVGDDEFRPKGASSGIIDAPAMSDALGSGQKAGEKVGSIVIFKILDIVGDVSPVLRIASPLGEDVTVCSPSEHRSAASSSHSVSEKQDRKKQNEDHSKTGGEVTSVDIAIVSAGTAFKQRPKRVKIKVARRVANVVSKYPITRTVCDSNKGEQLDNYLYTLSSGVRPHSAARVRFMILG